MSFLSLKTNLIYEINSLRIVYYHVVSAQNPEYYFNSKSIGPTTFREHLMIFQKHFDIISLTEALTIAAKGESLKKKLVLTFDDGFRENYSVIAPILKEKGMPATFFLVSNCIDNNDLMWRNKLIVVKRRRLSRLPGLISMATRMFSLPAINYYEDIMKWSLRAWPMSRKDEIANYFWHAADIGTVEEYLKQQQPYLTAGEICCLLKEGFEIGSHSMSHPVFSRLSYEEFSQEIVGSIRLLQAKFNREITSFSYPFGIQANPVFEQKLIKDDRVALKTFLGTKNKLENRHDCLQWQRDNLEFPKNKMLFRFKILPLLRRFTEFS